MKPIFCRFFPRPLLAALPWLWLPSSQADQPVNRDVPFVTTSSVRSVATLPNHPSPGGQVSNVPQAFAPCQLGEDHAYELLAAAEMADAGFGVVALDQVGKRLAIHEVEDLGKDVASGVHRAAPWRNSLKNSKA